MNYHQIDNMSHQMHRKVPSCVLVTGCAGFIGSHFCAYVSAAYPSVKIIGIDNFWNSTDQDVPSGIIFHKGDIRDIAFLAHLFETYVFDAVFHFAAIPQVQYCQEHTQESREVNVLGTQYILDAIAQKQPHCVFIFSSSAAVYGNTNKVPVEEGDPTYPAGAYGAQKLEAERVIRHYVQAYKIEAVILRYFNVFGDGQKGDSPYSTVIAKWCDSLSAGRPIRIDGDGLQSRDFIPVSEIARANFMAYLKGVTGGIYNIAGGQDISLLDLKQVFEQVLHRPVEVTWAPAREVDIKRSLASVVRAETELGFRYAVQDTELKDKLYEDISKTIGWWLLI